jgi:hypothetical protein
MFYVLFVCKCVLPPVVNPVAVDKYINININKYRRQVLPRPRRLVTGLSSRRLRCSLLPVSVGFVVDQAAQGEICFLSFHYHSTLIFMFLLLLSEGQAVDSGNVKASNVLSDPRYHWTEIYRHLQNVNADMNPTASSHKTYIVNELNEIMFFNDISKDINGLNSFWLSLHAGKTPNGQQGRAHPHQPTYSHVKCKTGQILLPVLHCIIHIYITSGRLD